MNKRLITFDELREYGITYSKPHLWRLEKANKFPRRVRIGGSNTHSAYAYVESEIREFVEGLIAARDKD